jgi:hypothetical protein
MFWTSDRRSEVFSGAERRAAMCEVATELGIRNVADLAILIARQRELIMALQTNGHHGLAEEAERFLLALRELRSERTARLQINIAPPPNP